MKRPFYILFLISLILVSCNGNRKKNAPDRQVVEERYMSAENCEREFEKLINTMDNLDAAISETEFFINKWASCGYYQVDDAKQIRRDLAVIENLVDNLLDLKTFREEVRMYPQYENSDYNIIRHAWRTAVKDRDAYLVYNTLSTFTSDSFVKHMRENIESIVEEDAKSLLGWTVNSVDILVVPDPVKDENRDAMKATGEFRAHLVGAVFGIDKRSTRIRMDMEMGISASGDEYCKLVNYSYPDGINF